MAKKKRKKRKGNLGDVGAVALVVGGLLLVPIALVAGVMIYAAREAKKLSSSTNKTLRPTTPPRPVEPPPPPGPGPGPGTTKTVVYDDAGSTQDGGSWTAQIYTYELSANDSDRVWCYSFDANGPSLGSYSSSNEIVGQCNATYDEAYNEISRAMEIAKAY